MKSNRRDRPTRDPTDLDEHEADPLAVPNDAKMARSVVCFDDSLCRVGGGATTFIASSRGAFPRSGGVGLLLGHRLVLTPRFGRQA